MKNWVLRIALVLLSSALAVAQQPAGKLSFEVASIKPSAPPEIGRIRISMSADGGMLRYTNVSLREVIRAAYRVKDYQIEGPDWLNSARFDIMAKFPDGATEDNVPEMLQSLLADRFKLVLHRDTKEHAVYALVADKNGPKLKPTEVQASDGTAAVKNPETSPAADKMAAAQRAAENAKTAQGPKEGIRLGSGDRPSGMAQGQIMMMMDPSGMHLKAMAATLGGLSDMLSRFTERPIVDMTGIQGKYDFDLVFSPETIKGGMMMRRPVGPPPSAGAGADGPPSSEAPVEQGATVFDAVKAYGLKLEPRKAPLEMLTIDSIEKTPTEN